MAQESLTNVARHAGAKTAQVTLDWAEDRVVLTVRDDGRGFIPREHRHGPSDGIGLYGMRERASLVGGMLRIDSRPGAGTTVTVEVPGDA